MGSLLSMSVYVWVRLMFFDFPFEFLEEAVFILRILMTGWVMAALCIGGFDTMIFVADNHRELYQRVKAGWQPAMTDKEITRTMISPAVRTGSVKIIMKNKVLYYTRQHGGKSYLLANGGVKIDKAILPALRQQSIEEMAVGAN